MTKLRSTALTTAVLTLSSLAAAPAMALTLGYQLSINDPVFNSTSGNLNVPDFELVNTSDAGIGITDFSLTIGDTDFNFDFVRIQTAFVDPGADLNFTLNTVGLSNNGIGDDILDYDFTGFDSGDVFRFEVDVDPDSGSPSQDFRAVLFPAAQVSVTFSNGNTLTETLNPSNTAPSGHGFGQVATVPLPGGLALYLAAGLIGGGIAWRRSRS